MRPHIIFPTTVFRQIFDIDPDSIKQAWHVFVLFWLPGVGSIALLDSSCAGGAVAFSGFVWRGTSFLCGTR